MNFVDYLTEIQSPFDSKIVKRAIDVSRESHKNQFRKSGEEYFVHPKRVAQIVKRFKRSKRLNQLVAAALLHDTVEDTTLSLKDVKSLFGGLISNLVEELTSDEQKIKRQGKAQYLSEKMKNMSSWALVIKLSDRLDNVSDLKTAKPDFVRRYRDETLYILNELENARKLSDTQNKLITAIKKKLHMLLREL